jgi:predicted MPP superfamily phosphohydrolase
MNFPRALIIYFIILFLYLALQGYLFFRIRDYLRRGIFRQEVRRFLLGFVAALFLIALFPVFWRFFVGWQSHPPIPWVFRSLSFFSAIWGFGSIGAVLILLAYEVFRALLRLSGRAVASPDLQRRDFLKTAVGIAATTPFLVSGYGVLLGRRRFEVEDFELPVSGLSSDLSHFSIVQLTDIHVGPFMPAEDLAAYVEAINRLKPDVIALTGDFISTTVDEVAPCVDTLAGLKARYGVFACMGNHDVYAGAENELTRRFAAKGIHVLRNDAISLSINQTKLSLLGIDDLRWGKPDLRRALRTAEREPSEVKLLLSHRPEAFPQAAQSGIDVVLSGHYHGGQVKLDSDPESLSIARFITPYPEGMFRLPRQYSGPAPDQKDALLFVSRGIGITGLPIRINCPPQIAHLRLKRA